MICSCLQIYNIVFYQYPVNYNQYIIGFPTHQLGSQLTKNSSTYSRCRAEEETRVPSGCLGSKDWRIFADDPSDRQIIIQKALQKDIQKVRKLHYMEVSLISNFWLVGWLVHSKLSPDQFAIWRFEAASLVAVEESVCGTVRPSLEVAFAAKICPFLLFMALYNTKLIHQMDQYGSKHQILQSKKSDRQFSSSHPPISYQPAPRRQPWQSWKGS